MWMAVVSSTNLPFEFTKMTNDFNTKGKVFVVTHTKPSRPLPMGYEYIGVGKDNLGLDFSDKSGNSIENLNPYFSELTAIYWIWKNYICDPNDFIGIMHYRKILVRNFFSAIIKQPIGIRRIEKILSEFDLIVPEKNHLPPNVYRNYSKEHELSDLKLALSIAESRDKVEAGKYFTCLEGMNSAHACNMLICRKSLFDEYCSWLFPILLDCLKEIDFKDRDSYQKRVFGFLSERLFNVWLDREKLSRK